VADHWPCGDGRLTARDRIDPSLAIKGVVGDETRREKWRGRERSVLLDRGAVHALREQSIGRTGRVHLQVNFTPEPAKPATPLAAQLLADFKDDTADDDFKHTAPTSSTKFQYDDGPKVSLPGGPHPAAPTVLLRCAFAYPHVRACVIKCHPTSLEPSGSVVLLYAAQELPQSYGGSGQARAKTALEEKFPQLANSGFEPQPSWQVCHHASVCVRVRVRVRICICVARKSSTTAAKNRSGARLGRRTNTAKEQELADGLAVTIGRLSRSRYRQRSSACRARACCGARMQCWCARGCLCNSVCAYPPVSVQS
jgi:hypothetical protein